MEVVNHINVLDIGGRRLVGDIDGMFQRQIPYRECFELRISRFNSPLVFVIELSETGCEFSAVWSGCVHDDERTRRFDIRIFSVSFVGNNRIDVRGIPFGKSVQIYFYSPRLEFVFIGNR